MPKKVVLACALAGALSISAAATAAPGTVKVTGGGQVLTDGKDTVGFNAQRTGDAVKGQFQYVDRAADGSTQTQYHGTITCFTQIGDNAAYLGGVWRNVNGDPNEEAEFFRLYVEDNGEPNRGIDQIVVDQVAPDPTCDDDDAPAEEEQLFLSRGNVQFHNAKAKRKRTSAPTTRTVSLAGLR